jgi:drug/metabolite transporter (DMT)-like permease
MRIVLLVILLAIVFFVADYFGLNAWLHPHKWYLLAFFACLSYLHYLLTQKGMANNRAKFVPFFMASSFSRLLLSFVLLAYFLFQRIPQTYLFVSNFFVLYLLFTGFEIYGLYANLRRFS